MVMAKSKTVFDSYRERKAWELVALELEIKLAKKIGENLYETGLLNSDPSLIYPGPPSDLYILDPSSDARLRIRNSNRRITGINPVDGTKATDPVYRKISKIEIEYRSPAYFSFFLEELKTKMERRKMGEEEYMHILETPENKLIEEWEAKIEKASKSGLRSEAAAWA